MKKKVIAMLLACATAFSLAACGGGGSASGSAAGSEDVKSASGASGQTVDMNIAMITDSGDITDQSFNQTTYEACKSWAGDNQVEFTYL